MQLKADYVSKGIDSLPLESQACNALIFNAYSIFTP